MAETSAIEWTQATWNPWMGCTRVSPGCAHCYMFKEQRQYGHDPEVVRRSKTKFADPLKWKEPRTIFTCSWSDWFHADADQWRDEAWDIIRRTPHHTYQILTKRPERIAEHLPRDWGHSGYPNVWLGVSVESQRYDYRAALLCQFPAAVRFISAEPLLAPLHLTRVNPYERLADRQLAWMDPDFIGVDVLEWPNHPPVAFVPGRRMGRIDWVIAGGESGPSPRPFDLNWARILRDDCARAGVAFFLKQLGGFPDKRGGEKALLDGVRHTEMPLVFA
jgi:protein gp37